MLPAQRTGRTDWLLYAALALLFAIAVTYRLRDTADRFDELQRGHEIARIPFNVSMPEFVINELLPEAQAAGLMDGDRLLAVAGRPVRTALDVMPSFRRATAGAPVAILAERTRGGSRQAVTASVTMQPIRESAAPTAVDWASLAIARVALPYICLALGFWVAAVRIRDKLAWLLLLLLLSLAEFTGDSWRTVWGRTDWFQPVSVMYQPVLSLLWPTSMMLFGLYFPERLPLDRRFPWLKWVVVVPVLVSLAATIAIVLLVMTDAGRAGRFAAVVSPLRALILLLHVVAIGSFFPALGFKISKEQRPDARRRLVLLVTGAVVGISPLCVLAVVLVSGLTRFQSWMVLPAIGMVFVFPLTMAYVIVVHRAMDVRLVIRQGVRYVLARGTIRAIQLAASAAIIVAVGLRVGPFASDGSGAQVLLVGGGLIAILQIRRATDWLRQWVDRRFFRDAYDAEQILAELAGRVRTIVETRPLLETVAHQISTALHVPRLAILLNGGGVLRPAYALGYSEVPSVPVADSAWTEAEASLRRALDAELVLPLSSNDKLIGVMGLGPKRSEEPYTRGDMRLLDAVVVQTGLALENSRLTAEIAAEVANREKAARELEIAREVQQRLFPQECPPIAGIQYAGSCRPALGVGGDYYDFIALDGTSLSIAIGDVSGKGIPAALLMATLRAYLRGQTIGRDIDLTAVMSNLNQLVYESSAANRYATFFFAHYDATTGTIRYVNAGHNPPMLLRASGAIERLDVGGPVIGLIEDVAYEQGRACLHPGDVLVAFTDGVSEAMDAQFDEWGEERLADTLRAHAGCPPAHVIERILAGADAFVAGAPQHDDMTIVVVRREVEGGP